MKAYCSFCKIDHDNMIEPMFCKKQVVELQNSIAKVIKEANAYGSQLEGQNIGLQEQIAKLQDALEKRQKYIGELVSSETKLKDTIHRRNLQIDGLKKQSQKDNETILSLRARVLNNV